MGEFLSLGFLVLAGFYTCAPVFAILASKNLSNDSANDLHVEALARLDLQVIYFVWRKSGTKAS